MKERELKAMLGPQRWKEFLKFMRGQTVALDKDGNSDYYAHDIEKFLTHRDMWKKLGGIVD